MAKLITTPIGSFTQAAVTTINANMDAIEAAVENTLSRDGTTPNQMGADIDMNNNDILNVDTMNASTIILDGEILIPGDINSGTALDILNALKTVDGAGSGLDADLLDGQHGAFYAIASDLADHIVDPTDAHDATAISFAPTGSIAAVNVQTAIAELDAEKQPLDSDLTAIAALTTTSHGRALLTTTAANDLRLSEAVPTYVTLANLLNLDTNKDTVAYVTDNSFEDVHKWVGTDLSSRTVNQSVTTTSINSTTNVLTKVAHNLSTGMGIVPGTAVNGLSLNTVYWVRKIDANTFTLHPTVEDSVANTNIFDLTGTTNFTMKQLVDPVQDVYIIKTGGQVDGSAGAWIRTPGSRSLGIGRARYRRINDRLLVGLGATGWMGDHSGPMGSSGAGSWLFDEMQAGGTAPMSYLLVQAGIASVPAPISGFPSSGVLGAVRTLDGLDNGSYIGIAGFASGHATSGTSQARAGYFEAVKGPGYTGTAQTFELEITNLDSTPTAIYHPDAAFVANRSMCVLVATGGGPLTNPTPFDADMGIVFDTNGAKFRTGITFTSNSLTKDVTTDYQHAILLPSKARVEWYTSNGLGNYAYTIHSEISDAAHQMFTIASDTGLAITNTGGKRILNLAYVANAVNHIAISPASTGNGPNLQIVGDDANADFSLISRGTGGIRLRDGSANNKFVINTTGIGFFNATPVAAGALALPTGTLTRTTFATGTVTTAQLAERVFAIINDLRAYGLFT